MSASIPVRSSVFCPDTLSRLFQFALVLQDFPRQQVCDFGGKLIRNITLELCLRDLGLYRRS